MLVSLLFLSCFHLVFTNHQNNSTSFLGVYLFYFHQVFIFSNHLMCLTFSAFLLLLVSFSFLYHIYTYSYHQFSVFILTIFFSHLFSFSCSSQNYLIFFSFIKLGIFVLRQLLIQLQYIFNFFFASSFSHALVESFSGFGWIHCEWVSAFWKFTEGISLKQKENEKVLGCTRLKRFSYGNRRKEIQVCHSTNWNGNSSLVVVVVTVE